MFAVPGWSVDSSLLKTQTELPVSSSSKKRKRRKGRQGEKTEDVQSRPAKQPKRHDETAVRTKADDKPQKKHKKRQDPTSNPNASPVDRSKEHHKSTTSTDPPTPAPQQPPPPPPPPPAANTKLTPLQSSMRQKLISSRFRHLNETLYTTPSSSARALIAADPSLFSEYHAGFRQQVSAWPSNPVDSFTADVLSRGGSASQPSHRSKHPSPPPLPRTSGTCTIADLGCGDAGLAQALQPHLARLRLRTHSFDLHAASPLVTPADIAALPLDAATVDVAVLCLALMGTNWPDFVDEAWRVLRWRGECWVAEIRSRFAGKRRAGPPSHAVGRRRKNADDDAASASADVEPGAQPQPSGEAEVSAFVEVMRRHGFALAKHGEGEGEGGGRAVDLTNRMFVKLRFVKAAQPTRERNVKPAQEERGAGRGAKLKFLDEEEGDVDEKEEASVLRPCLYKVR